MLIPMKLSPDQYLRALRFAAQAHGEQRVPGSELPYVVHLGSVAMEVLATALQLPGEPCAPFDLDLAATAALLHDTVEDTEVPAAEIEREFGPTVAACVRALSKDARLPKSEQLADSLARIIALPGELARVAAIVKLADRITNLQPPPRNWSADKRAAYQAEARVILRTLQPVSRCPPLERRLADKIEAYGAFLG
jgi:(p)ppGpp synthase/HD superfamily hydrolase